MPRKKKTTAKAKMTVGTEATKLAMEPTKPTPVAPPKPKLPTCEVCGQEKAKISIDRGGVDIVLLCNNRDCSGYRLLKRADYDNRKRP